MDYAPHGSLRKKHPRGKQVPLDSIVSYVKQAALALQYAHTHEQRVIHRDVKPENLLLKTPDFVLLSDFGIATAARTVTTANSVHDTNVAGTYAYMAPEQLVGCPCFASDQYSLAIMVYEWLCGEPPFSGQEYAQWLYQHQQMSPPPLQERVPSLPPDVEAVVFKALAKKPQDRFARVEDFATYLEWAARGKALPPNVTSVRSTNQLDPSPAGKRTGIPSQTPPNPIEQLIREGVQAQARGEVQRAYNLWQKIATMPDIPSHYTEVAQNGIQELRPQIIPLLCKRANQAALRGHGQDEIRAWEELLTLKPSDGEIGSPLTLAISKGDTQRRIQERIRIARQNEQWTWMYVSAEQFIREQDKAAAQAQLRMLWHNAPYYGDPAGLAKEVDLPSPRSYEQALAEERIHKRALAEEQAHEQAFAEERIRKQALAEEQARLKRQRKTSIISIPLSILSVVLSIISVAWIIVATNSPLIFVLLAVIVGVVAGAKTALISSRRLLARKRAAAIVSAIATVTAAVLVTASTIVTVEVIIVGLAMGASIAALGAAVAAASIAIIVAIMMALLEEKNIAVVIGAAVATVVVVGIAIAVKITIAIIIVAIITGIAIGAVSVAAGIVLRDGSRSR